MDRQLLLLQRKKLDPCNPASTPPDFNHNGISDLNDPDNDSDGVANNQDQLQFDASNGVNSTLPISISFSQQTQGIAKSGFPGVLLPSNASTTELGNNGHGFGIYQPTVRIRANGVSGALGLVSTMGSDQGPNNTQDNALDTGFDATKGFTITTTMNSPFGGRTGPVTTTEEGGLFFGLDADNYVKLVVRRISATQMTLVVGAEANANYQEGVGQTVTPAISLPFSGTVDLAIVSDPSQPNTLQVRYALEPPTGGGTGTPWTTIATLNTTNFPALSNFFIAPHCSGSVGSGCVALAGLQTTGPDIAFGFSYFAVQP